MFVHVCACICTTGHVLKSGNNVYKSSFLFLSYEFQGSNSGHQGPLSTEASWKMMIAYLGFSPKDFMVWGLMFIFDLFEFTFTDGQTQLHCLVRGYAILIKFKLGM